MDDAFALNVNGHDYSVSADPARPLLDVLREDLQLTGAKYGCGERECGACSVLIDGKREFSCRFPASKAAGRKIVTIEGISNGEELHPIQQAFLEEHAFQCGYCTAGMIVTAVELLSQRPAANAGEVNAAMNRNICRCGTYPRIQAAVLKAAARTLSV